MKHFTLLIFLSLFASNLSLEAEEDDLLKSCRGTEIPPRVSHFNGVGAHGYFETAASPHPDIEKYTKARLFQGASMKTPVFIRFSMASQDPVIPDAKGFSIRFYGSDSLMDIVGQHIPNFLLSDLDTFHTLASAPKNPNKTTQDVNGYWTFNSHHPQTLLHNLMLFSDPLADSMATTVDLGYPSSFRFLPGGAVHTYRLTNEKGESFWAKFHWTPEQTPKEGELLNNATNLNAALIDLYSAIDMSKYPSWSFGMQVMTLKQAEDLTVTSDSHDLTRLWPMDTFPLIPLGKIVLNQNPHDYSSDVELVAFDPSLMPSGIDLSPPELDPIMPLRVGAYKMMQAKRLPTNSSKLPINGLKFSPRAKPGPSTCGATTGPMSMSKMMGEEPKFEKLLEVKKGRKIDFAAQAGDFYKGLKAEDQKRLARNLASGMRGINPDTKVKTLEYFKMAGEQLQKDVESMLK